MLRLTSSTCTNFLTVKMKVKPLSVCPFKRVHLDREFESVSLPRHEACRVMRGADLSIGSYLYTNKGFFFLFTSKYIVLWYFF